jgi:gas vesicle structural protein
MSGHGCGAGAIWGNDVMSAPASRPALTARPRPCSFQRPVSLAEVLDRVLTKGVVVAGEVVLTVADIDLVYLGVNIVLCSIETARGSLPPKESASAAG